MNDAQEYPLYPITVDIASKLELRSSELENIKEGKRAASLEKVKFKAKFMLN